MPFGRPRPVTRAPADAAVVTVQPLESRRLLSAVLTTLASFTDGPAQESGHVAIDANGDLFGINFATDTTAGPGYIWELPKTSAGYAAKVVTLAPFPNGLGLDNSNGQGLVVTPDGDLFGLSSITNTSNNGPYGINLWELPKTAAGGYGSVVVAAALPFVYDAGQLAVDPSGDVFGVVLRDGDPSNATGEVFEYTPAGQLEDAADFTETDMYAGVTGMLGAPEGGLASDADGDIYGFAGYGGDVLTTYQGSGGPVTEATGDIFVVRPGSGAVSIVASVPVADADLLGGVYPQVSVATVGGNTVVYGINSTNAFAATVAGPGASATAVDLGVYGPGGNDIGGRAAAADAAGDLYGDTTTGIWEAAVNPDGTQAAPADVATISADGTAGPISYLTSDGTNVFGETEGTIFAVGPAAVATLGGQTPTPTPTSTATALTPTVASSTLAAAVVSGTKAKPGKVVVTVANSSTATETGAAKVALYATTTGVIDSDSTLLGFVGKKLKLAAGKSVTVVVPVKSLQLAAGTYTVLPQTTDAVGMVTDGTAGPTVTVAAPFVDLTAVVGAVTPTAVTAGKPITVTLTLTNTGNTDVKGAGSVTLALSTDGTTLSVPFTPVKHAITVKANGKALSVRLKVKTPATVPAGTYVVLASVVQGANTATAVGTTQVTFGA